MKRYLWMIMAAVALMATVSIPLGLPKAGGGSYDTAGQGESFEISSAAYAQPEEEQADSENIQAEQPQHTDSSDEAADQGTASATPEPAQESAHRQEPPATSVSPASRAETSSPSKPAYSKPSSTRPSSPAPSSSRPASSRPQSSGSQNGSLSYAEQVVQLVNQERAREGLKPLAISQPAAAAAQKRAREIETEFSHTRPDGTSFSTALAEQGASYRRAGENIAWGQKTPEQVVQGWMNSSGHRANILNANFTAIGVGYYQNAAGRPFWAQLFIG